MKKKIKYDKLLNIRISSNDLKCYQDYCDENSYSLSKRIRYLLNKDIKGELKNL